jgi:hypothetical protein
MHQLPTRLAYFTGLHLLTVAVTVTVAVAVTGLS